ncbi:MAG: DUF4878 domain-containing protein [Rikenellaceae bacterium]
MKKLFTLLTVACAFVCMVACSSSSSPEAVVAQYNKCMQKGDVDGLLKLFYMKDQDADKIAKQTEEFKELMDRMMLPEIEKMGGIKSFEVGEAKISEDGLSAKVPQATTYGNGETYNQPAKLVKVDGKWYIDFSK